MTGVRIYYQGPAMRRYLPQPPEPIGVARSHIKAGLVGTSIVNLIHSVGPLLVLVDPKGHVFVVPRDSERARAFGHRRPDWIVGIFNRSAAASDIAEAILATLNVALEDSE